MKEDICYTLKPVYDVHTDIFFISSSEAVVQIKLFIMLSCMIVMGTELIALLFLICLLILIWNVITEYEM